MFERLFSIELYNRKSDVQYTTRCNGNNLEEFSFWFKGFASSC